MNYKMKIRPIFIELIEKGIKKNEYRLNAKKGDQFVVRANHRYDLCYGFDENHNPCSDSGLQNIVIEEDGTIVVTFINGDSKSLYYRYVD